MDQSEEFELNQDELSEATEIIRKAPAGTYTLKKLYGPVWNKIESPTNFGGRFKASVEAGRLAKVELQAEKTGSNAARYIVF